MQLDSIDRKLLNLVQLEFPLTREPYAELGLRLGINDDDAIYRIARLKTEGIIRLIGPIFNVRRLGYQNTLVAMKISAERLNEARQIINMHQRVSHCYERDNDFNFWFTLAIPAGDDIESELHKLDTTIKPEATLNLPAITVFKIGAYFNIGEGDWTMPNVSTDDLSPFNEAPDLSPIDRGVINELQQDLAPTARPFDFMSTHMSMDINEFLSHCQSLLQRGIIRRYTASVNHNSIGFTANAMGCWKVPPAMVETTGKKMAKFKEISHCYERKVNPLWPYNLYTMMHADTKEACEAIAARVATETGFDTNALALLFTTREIKKTRVQYPV